MNSTVLIQAYSNSLIRRIIPLVIKGTNLLKAVDISNKEYRNISDEVRYKINHQKRLLHNRTKSFLPNKYKEVIDNKMSKWKKDNWKSAGSGENPSEYYNKEKAEREKLINEAIKQWIKDEPIPKKEKKSIDILLEVLRKKYPNETDKYLLKVYNDYKISASPMKLISPEKRKERDEAEKVKRQKHLKQREKDWKEQLSTMPKTENLFTQWAHSTNSAKLFELLNLVGNLNDRNKKDSIKRLERFINEKIVEEDDKKALTTILETMKEEFAEEERKRISTAGRTATYLEARAIGATLGSKPNNKKGKVKGTKISKTGLHTIRWGNFTNDNSKITRKGVEFLKEDAPMDLSQERWLNDPLLSDYAEYRIQEIEPEMTIPNFRNSENKDEIISQVKRKQPKLPEPSNTLVTMMGIWNEVGDNIEDFPYFLQGWKNAVITGFVEIATDEIMVLFDFSNKVLPKLVNAINKGVILNPNTGEVSFDNIIRNYKRAINQIPRGLRSSIITTVFNIAQGNKVSSDKKGKTKQQLQKAEDVIINQLQEEVPNTNKTYAHFILENHLKINRRKRGGSILVDLLKTIEEEEGKIEYLKQPKSVSTEKPVSRRGPQRKPVASDKFGSTSQIAGSKFQELRERLEPADADIDEPYKGEYEFPQRGTDKEVDMKVGSRPDGTRVPKHSKLSETEWRKKLSEDGKSQEEIDSIIGYNEKGERVKKSLETLLDMINESDDIIFKEDVGLILESLNAKQKKKLKTILNVADPTEYFGHDFLKLEELIKVLKTLGVVKGDKKLNKKILRYEDKNLKVVKLATRLRKDYENLYRGLRELIYPKTGDNK